MTVLRHQLLGIDGNPVAGHTAQVMAYQPEAPGKGYRRTTVVSAVSDDDGFLEWKLPRPKTGVTNPVYVVTGIEAQQVLVTVPTSVSTATVAETRTGTLPLPPGAENGTDLVTEEELATRLAGLTPALPARLSEEALRSAFGRRVTIDDLPTSGIISAHRGSSRDNRPVAPEGSMSAYRLAVALGVHIIDVDNQTTADGVPVAVHDTTVDAVTASTGNVSSFPFHQLPPISMPEVVGSGWPAEPISAEEQILTEFGGRVLITIEPKGGLPGVAPLVALIKRYGLERSVYINTSAPTVAQAVTDAGCLAHVYGVTTTAGIDVAVAAGAKLIEIPFNASAALVAHAQASGVHRFIAGPIAHYDELRAMTPGIQGYVNDSVGYLGRPGGEARRVSSSLAVAKATLRRPAGWRTHRPLGGSMGPSPWLTAGGLLVRDTADNGYNAYHLGDLSGDPAASGSIRCRFVMVSLPDPNQRVGLRVLCPEDSSNGADLNTKGYVISLRASGQLNLWSSPLAAYGGGVALGTTPTGTALVAGTTYEILFEWTATQVRLTRVDTGDTTGWVNNTDWRGRHIHTVSTMTTSRALIEDVIVA